MQARHVGVVLVLAFAAAACVGPTWSTANMMGADTALEEAAEAGAESKAPYEYTYAQEMLRKASEEWGYSDFGMARKYAELAKDFAEKAKRKAQQDPWMGPPTGPKTTIDTSVAPPTKF